MSANKSTYITLLALILFAIVYFISADSLTQPQDTGTLGSGYFPKLLSILLVILCVINIFQTRKKEDHKIPLPHLKTILITIGLTALYFLSWGLFGFFYVHTFLYLIILFTFYQPSKKHLPIYVVTALLITLFIYLLFDNLLGIRF